MRSALIALLAFAAGVLLMWLALPRTAPSLVTTPAPLFSPSADRPSDTAMPGSTDTSAASFDSDADAAQDDWPTDAPTPEQVIYAQPQLLDTALTRLSPRVAGKPNLYLLAFAGDGTEDVFRNEVEYAARLVRQRFGASAHALVLENNPAALTTRPLASWSNLEAALDGLAKVMKPDQDILLLYLTTHGGADHSLLVDMDPLPLDQLDAVDLGAILKKRPFRWKVVVVNACYSGGFVPSLRGPGTLVLTAARSDRSSFGCGSESDVTYFGHAWLVDALNRTPDFIEAFQQARSEISGWEKSERLLPSEPQIDVGSGIEAQLARWREGFAPGPKVPFHAAHAPSTRSAATQ